MRTVLLAGLCLLALSVEAGSQCESSNDKQSCEAASAFLRRQPLPAALRDSVFDVPVLNWELENAPFANDVARADQPLILQNTPVKRWAALTEWTPKKLGDRLATLRNVKKTLNVNQTYYYCHDAPFDKVVYCFYSFVSSRHCVGVVQIPAVADVYHARCHSEAECTARLQPTARP